MRFLINPFRVEAIVYFEGINKKKKYMKENKIDFLKFVGLFIGK